MGYWEWKKKEKKILIAEFLVLAVQNHGVLCLGGGG